MLIPQILRDTTHRESGVNLCQFVLLVAKPFGDWANPPSPSCFARTDGWVHEYAFGISTNSSKTPRPAKKGLNSSLSWKGGLGLIKYPEKTVK